MSYTTSGPLPEYWMNERNAGAVDAGVSPEILTERNAGEGFDAVELITASGWVRASSRAPEDAGSASHEGWVWEAEMLKPGLSLNGNTYYTPEFIREAAQDFEGCPSYADHQASPSGSIRNVVGQFQNVRAESQGPVGGAVMKGELHLLKSENWIREKTPMT